MEPKHLGAMLVWCGHELFLIAKLRKAAPFASGAIFFLLLGFLLPFLNGAPLAMHNWIGLGVALFLLGWVCLVLVNIVACRRNLRHLALSGQMLPERRPEPAALASAASAAGTPMGLLELRMKEWFLR